MDRRPAAPTRTTPAPEPRKTVLRSDELTCPSCVHRIERVLLAEPGVAHAAVHVATGRIEVRHDPDRVSVPRLVDLVAEAGYRATPSPL